MTTPIDSPDRPVWLCEHSLRTWSWAALLAQRDALKPDTEVLAVSCLLHDVALPPYGRPPAGLHCACFAVDGGQWSRLFLQAQGWEAAALDVVGARIAAIDPASRQAVLARYPRTGFALRRTAWRE